MAHEIKSLGISSTGENNQQQHQHYGVDSHDKTAPSMQQQQQQQHDLAHTSALLSNYDANYAAGMSSDSELSRNRRHHHSSAGSVNGGGHHHRPYSSQSRVYHAHPAPRTQTASSRSSHYSDSAASPYMPNRPIQQQQQQQQQQLIQQKPPTIDTTKTVTTGSGHLLTNQPASAPLPLSTGTPPQSLAQGSRSHLAHQTSISSSGSGGSASSIAAYLGMNPMDSALLSKQQQQQQLVRLKSTGRQLPQRPFKQSMSIDHHPLMVSQQYSGAMPGPAQQSQPGPMMPQQLAPDLGALGGDGGEQQGLGPAVTDLLPYQQQTTLWQQAPGSLGPQQHPQRQNAPASASGGQSLSQQHERFVAPGQRNFRHDIESMDRQTANLSLYDNNSNYAGASLPPTVGRPSSTSSIRQLPAIDPTHHHSSSALLAGSMSVDRHHPQQLPRHHQPNDAQLPPAPYSTSSNIVDAQRQRQLLTHQQISQASASAEWLPGTSSGSGPIPMTASHHMSRTGEGSGGHPGLSQFKQATSIDHYPMRGVSTTNVQQQPHYMPQYCPPSTDPYQQQQPQQQQSHGMLGYANSSPVASYDSPTRRQQQQQQQALSDHYLAYSDKQQQANEIYYPHSRHMLPGYSSGHTSHQSSVGTPPSAGSSGPNVDPHIQHDNLGHPSHAESYSPYVGGNFKREQLYTGRGSSSEHNRPVVQHQMSSSSSNNSQSGSLNSDSRHPGELLKPTSSAPAQHHQDAQHQYQSQQLGRSPQHKSNIQHHRSDMLRRGYTSASTAYDSGAISGGGIGTGSNTALSDIGDASVSQSSAATHSGTMASHSLGTNNRRAVRAVSPSAPFETGTTSAGSGSHAHHTSEGKEVSGIRSESSTGLPNGSSGASSSLTKKSNSATQLSMSGTKKRLGFRKKQVTSFSVHRSEEVAPFEARHLVKQGSSVSEGDSSMSGDSSSRSWSNSNFKQPTSDELASMSFIDGLGKGQMISRQGLASPYLGDIQLSLCDRRGNLEVEVIRARNLQAKTNKILPLTYVKLYLVKNRKCLAKAKTTLSNKRTLNPLFQQQLTFHEDYRGCILQSIVWGNFGKMDKKNFMGIAQISIDDLELSDTVISWYKLFLPSSLQTLPSKSLRHTLLSNSTESFTNSNNPQQ